MRGPRELTTDNLPDRPPTPSPAIVAIRGGMMFPRIVVQAEACRFLDEFGIAYTEYEAALCCGFYRIGLPDMRISDRGWCEDL
jgi:hypothetical protein